MSANDIALFSLKPIGEKSNHLEVVVCVFLLPVHPVGLVPPWFLNLSALVIRSSGSLAPRTRPRPSSPPAPRCIAAHSTTSTACAVQRARQTASSTSLSSTTSPSRVTSWGRPTLTAVPSKLSAKHWRVRIGHSSLLPGPSVSHRVGWRPNAMDTTTIHRWPFSVKVLKLDGPPPSSCFPSLRAAYALRSCVCLQRITATAITALSQPWSPSRATRACPVTSATDPTVGPPCTDWILHVCSAWPWRRRQQDQQCTRLPTKAYQSATLPKSWGAISSFPWSPFPLGTRANTSRG